MVDRGAYHSASGGVFYVLPVGDQIFTGSAIKPTVRVFDGISYEDGSGAGARLRISYFIIFVRRQFFPVSVYNGWFSWKTDCHL